MSLDSPKFIVLECDRRKDGDMRMKEQMFSEELSSPYIDIGT